jgi:hypothetical protein
MTACARKSWTRWHDSRCQPESKHPPEFGGCFFGRGNLLGFDRHDSRATV